MKHKGLIAVFVVPAVILLVPLVATLTSPEWNWGVTSFVVAYVLMTGVGWAYRWLTRSDRPLSYRIAAALALLAAFLLLWINLAVGLIGSEENPANLLYAGVLAIGAVGAIISRSSPRRLALVLVVVAVDQTLVPVIALLVWPQDFSPGVGPVFGLNACFVLCFAASAALFRRTSTI